MKKKTTKARSTKPAARRAKKDSTNLFYAIMFVIVLAVAAVLIYMNSSKPNVSDSDAKESAAPSQNPAGNIPFPSADDMSGR